MMFIKGFPNSHGYVNPRHMGRVRRERSIGSTASTTTPSSR